MWDGSGVRVTDSPSGGFSCDEEQDPGRVFLAGDTGEGTGLW